MRIGPLLCLLVVLGAIGCDGEGSECDCVFREDDFAVNLAVFEGLAEIPLNDFTVEAIINDVSVGQPDACRADAREDNTCAFGKEAGIYHVVVRAQGYESVEASLRIASPGRGALCCERRLRPKELNLSLTPE